MPRPTRLAALLVVAIAPLSLTTLGPAPRAHGAAAPAGKTQAPLDSVNFDAKKAIADLEASIKGRENAPAESVWKNIQGFKEMPAGRLLEMMAYTQLVNTRLREVKEMQSKEPTINCTTCHRGQVKPALNLK